MAESKQIAVIGAGPTGLSAIKACKEENVDVVCFERNEHPGGLWRYHDENIDGVASVMKTTIINTNKELSAFSDFPPPADFPNFMHHSMMYKYFLGYAKHFGLLEHIRYHREVIKIVQADSYNTTGRWKVTTKDSKTGDLESEEFDGVMVCIGHHVFPKIPQFPGQQEFRGTILHTHSLKKCDSFTGKRIVVVGVGNSGVDAAVDSTFVGEKVYLSTRRGTWLFSRVSERGECYDLAFSNRFNIFVNSFRSFDAVCNSIEGRLNNKFDHLAYNLKPKHRVLSAHPTTNDNLPNLILSGRVTIKGNIEKFVEDGVVFEGDKEVTKMDVVIFATGYHIKFPFLGEDVMSSEDNVISLYKNVFPPKLKHPTLCIIALVQPLGPIFPVGEMQSRWFMQVFKGKAHLPPLEAMLEEITRKREANRRRYVASTRHTIQVDFVAYLDEISALIGAKPNMWRLALTDPKFFWTCLRGPCLPYQYRINGPHKWEGAKDALVNYRKRFLAPLNTRLKSENLESVQNQSFLLLFVLIVAVSIFYKLFFS